MSSENVSGYDLEKNESYQKIVTIEKNIKEVVQKFVGFSKQVQEITHSPKEHHESVLRDLEKQSKNCSEQWMRSLESLDGIHLDNTQTLTKSKRKFVVNCANTYMDQADELIKQIQILKQNLESPKNNKNRDQSIEQNVIPNNDNVSSEIFKIIDVVNYLEKTLKIKPRNKDYSKEYNNYAKSKVSSELPKSVRFDINKIKDFYVKCSYNFDFMIKKHKTFFDMAVVRQISTPAAPSLIMPSTSTINSNEKKRKADEPPLLTTVYF